ncbi:hypothetical protein FIU93_01465 [Labrenzia sp. THAF35]|uniref:hypothetical protein n=1 Tax=Labrenzia sp. THAF35 TaxID=2587854 RepID=UPI0012690EE9|nr:hypothetical protein [Labrenzia sp. THAF35]QFT65428.1 hypothetical protein FIU93_01465 [Labrenzia sp. THAF35]
MGYRGEFEIAELPLKHTGQGRAAINHERRDNADRFDIVRISRSDGRSVLATVIGHYKADNVIQLDYDLRALLGVVPSENLTLEIDRVGILGTLIWYATVRDPQVRVSAVLAMVSLGLGVIGLVLGIISLVK